jgi:hypothetical protein
LVCSKEFGSTNFLINQNRKGESEMKKLMIKFIIVVAVLLAGLMTGCSDSGTPVTSSQGES